MEIKDFSPHLFWSYDRSADIEPEVVIKHVITYGEVRDKVLLERKVGKTHILKVIKNWNNREKYDKHISFMEKVILAK